MSSEKIIEKYKRFHIAELKSLLMGVELIFSNGYRRYAEGVDWLKRELTDEINRREGDQ